VGDELSGRSSSDGVKISHRHSFPESKSDLSKKSVSSKQLALNLLLAKTNRRVLERRGYCKGAVFLQSSY
jgi:hypothetical protein